MKFQPKRSRISLREARLIAQSYGPPEAFEKTEEADKKGGEALKKQVDVFRNRINKLAVLTPEARKKRHAEIQKTMKDLEALRKKIAVDALNPTTRKTLQDRVRGLRTRLDLLLGRRPSPTAPITPRGIGRVFRNALNTIRTELSRMGIPMAPLIAGIAEMARTILPSWASSWIDSLTGNMQRWENFKSALRKTGAAMSPPRNIPATLDLNQTQKGVIFHAMRLMDNNATRLVDAVCNTSVPGRTPTQTFLEMSLEENSQPTNKQNLTAMDILRGVRCWINNRRRSAETTPPPAERTVEYASIGSSPVEVRLNQNVKVRLPNTPPANLRNQTINVAGVGAIGLGGTNTLTVGGGWLTVRRDAEHVIVRASRAPTGSDASSVPIEVGSATNTFRVTFATT